jgi:hypothetical protein
VPLPAVAREDDIVHLYLRDQAGLVRFATTSLKVLWLGMSSHLTTQKLTALTTHVKCVGCPVERQG